MIEKAEEYIWANARVLEQRRFELLFKGGDPQPVIERVKPYKTPDGGYGYALEPDGRGPTSQPPHIWTALEALEDAGTHRRRRLATTSDHDRARRRRPRRRSPHWSRFRTRPGGGIGTEGSLLATSCSTRRSPEHGVDHPWLREREAFCWAAVDAIEQTHPYDVEAALAFLDAARDRDRAEQAAERLGELVKEQNLVGTQPEGYTEGEIHYPHDFARRPDSLARPWFTDDGDRAQPRPARGRAAGRRRLADHVAGVDCPRSSTSGAGS